MVLVRTYKPFVFYFLLKHCIDILHKINEDSPGEKLIVAMSVIGGRFDNDTPITTYKVSKIAHCLKILNLKMSFYSNFNNTFYGDNIAPQLVTKT